MSLRQPMNVGSAPDELPEAAWELLVSVPFRRGLDVEEIARIQEALWVELNAAIGRVAGENAGTLAGAEVFTLRGRGVETPLFPLRAGGRRFTCAEDVAEALERACAGTDLAEVMVDARGRAYDVSVEIQFRRCTWLDGVRPAPLAACGNGASSP